MCQYVLNVFILFSTTVSCQEALNSCAHVLCVCTHVGSIVVLAGSRPSS